MITMTQEAQLRERMMRDLEHHEVDDGLNAKGAVFFPRGASYIQMITKKQIRWKTDAAACFALRNMIKSLRNYRNAS